ncbi:hypothetical protein TNCT_429291, partial [Trichonephila clavata]
KWVYSVSNSEETVCSKRHVPQLYSIRSEVSLGASNILHRSLLSAPSGGDIVKDAKISWLFRKNSGGFPQHKAVVLFIWENTMTLSEGIFILDEHNATVTSIRKVRSMADSLCCKGFTEKKVTSSV